MQASSPIPSGIPVGQGTDPQEAAEAAGERKECIKCGAPVYEDGLGWYIDMTDGDVCTEDEGRHEVH